MPDAVETGLQNGAERVIRTAFDNIDTAMDKEITSMGMTPVEYHAQ